MANDLATLTGYLATALRDTTHEVWTEAEKQDLIRRSVDRLFPKVMKYVTQPVTVEYSASFINVGSASYPFTKIHRIDLYNMDPTASLARMVQEIPGAAWEVQGSWVPGSANRVYINPAYMMNASYYLLIHGHVPYDLTNNQIPDYLIPLVIARARAEAYRRMGADRAQFKNWLTSNQQQNVSVNELITLTNEADSEADRLEGKYNTRQSRPVVARR